MPREIIGLNHAEQTFREKYGKDRWFVSVTADHKRAALLLPQRRVTLPPNPPLTSPADHRPHGKPFTPEAHDAYRQSRSSSAEIPRTVAS